MKIVVIGTRGIPNIVGGVETHCEELYPRIAAMGHDITIIRRKPYVTSENHISEYKGVKLIDVYSPRHKSMETIVHTFLALLKAKRLKPDLIHIHAIGPSLLTPIARLIGLPVVVTNHGPDYNRQKWGGLAKSILKLGERMGATFANQIISISSVISDILYQKYGRTDTNLIYNGVTMPEKSTSRVFLDHWGVKRPYIVAIGRFVEEKGFHDLITAYQISGLKDSFDLVIAGDSDHNDAYSSKLKEQAQNNGVILTGYIKGESLRQLMTNASLFVIPSYHEGLPIALLEAMSYGLDIIASDISANRLPILDDGDFFTTGNVSDLAAVMIRKCSAPRHREFDLSAYNWDTIAEQTVKVYEKVINQVGA